MNTGKAKATKTDGAFRMDCAIDTTIHASAEKIWAFHTDGGVSHMTVILDPWTTRGIEQFGKVIEKVRSFE